MTSNSARGRAYAYVRFSTAKQELGASLKRQLERAEEYCLKHNLDLDTATYRDLGVSAFRGKNIQSGKLAAFIKAVELGQIKPNTYLLVEHFDRLSRDNVDDALLLLLKLCKLGIKVVTLTDGKVWDNVTSKDFANLILALTYMSRANEESARKASHLSDAWEKKKTRAANGQASRIVTSECPRWLKPNATKTGFVVLHDRVESIEKVFQMRVGGYGVSSIVSRANAEQWPVPGKGPIKKYNESESDFAKRLAGGVTWHSSTVGRLLKNRALLGEYQPHKNDPNIERHRHPVGEPIKNYYPAVIDPQLFLRAQAKAERSGRFPGRRDASLKNWLQGLLQCSCGQSFVRKNKDSKAQPEYARYYCTARTRGVSKCAGVGAKELESAVLYVISHIAPRFFDESSQVEAIKAKLDHLQLQQTLKNRELDNFVEAIASAPSTSTVLALTKRMDALQVELSSLRSEEATAASQLSELSGDHEAAFSSIARAVSNVENLDARARLREALARVIVKVVVHQVDGYISVEIRGTQQSVNHPFRVDGLPPETSRGSEIGIQEISTATDEEGNLRITDEAWLDRQMAELTASRRFAQAK